MVRSLVDRTFQLRHPQRRARGAARPASAGPRPADAGLELRAGEDPRNGRRPRAEARRRRRRDRGAAAGPGRGTPVPENEGVLAARPRATRHDNGGD